MIPLAAINQLAAVYRGRGRNEAYLEFAQEHFLDWLQAEHLFDDEAVVLKGGSAIRKFVLGNHGRFSTDLDFAVADPIYADHILERLDAGVTHEGVTFQLDAYDRSARKGTWHAETAEHGRTLPASLDFSARPLLLSASYPSRMPIPGLEATYLGFALPRPPVADLVETVAEKLSRFRRVMLGPTSTTWRRWRRWFATDWIRCARCCASRRTSTASRRDARVSRSRSREGPSSRTVTCATSSISTIWACLRATAWMGRH